MDTLRYRLSLICEFLQRKLNVRVALRNWLLGSKELEFMITCEVEDQTDDMIRQVDDFKYQIEDFEYEIGELKSDVERFEYETIDTIREDCEAIVSTKLKSFIEEELLKGYTAKIIFEEIQED